MEDMLLSFATCQMVKLTGQMMTNNWSAVAEMGDRLATIDTVRKLGAVPLCGGGAGSPSNTV